MIRFPLPDDVLRTLTHPFFMISILLISLASIFACSKKTMDPIVSPVTGTADTLKTYLALGDSYTIGQSVGAGERFPAQTVQLLKQQGIRIGEPRYIAQTGWTTENLQQAIASENLLPPYDVVSLLIGVNDQYQGRDTGGYALRFAQLLQKSIQLAGGNKARVFVLSIPDYSVTPFVPASSKPRVRQEIDWFNDINRRITLNAGVSYTDITPSTRQAETDPGLLANDGLHPSGSEYRKWAEMLAPKMKTLLQ